jgi:hypothetical protein
LAYVFAACLPLPRAAPKYFCHNSIGKSKIPYASTSLESNIAYLNRCKVANKIVYSVMLNLPAVMKYKCVSYPTYPLLSPNKNGKNEELPSVGVRTYIGET